PAGASLSGGDGSRDSFPRGLYRRGARVVVGTHAFRLRRTGRLPDCMCVRCPSKSVLDLEVSSVKKRMKDKAFARGVSREDVIKGAAELGVPLDEHIGFCIQ